MDWYKIIPPSNSGSYRSYYLDKRSGVGLLNTFIKNKLEEKKEEIINAKVKLTMYLSMLKMDLMKSQEKFNRRP
jgi:hypothetical protein